MLSLDPTPNRTLVQGVVQNVSNRIGLQINVTEECIITIKEINCFEIKLYKTITKGKLYVLTGLAF